MIRILLADNQPIMRFGLKTILEQQEDFYLVGEVIDVTEIIHLCSEFSPNLLLIDVELLGENCEISLNELFEQFPALKIVIFTNKDDVNTIRKVVGSRIDGYILKDEPPETLIRAIRGAMDGDIWLSRNVINLLAQPDLLQSSQDNDWNLTERETEVIRFLIKGCSNIQIANQLTITEGTVKNHLLNIYQKLGVHSRAEAIPIIINGWGEEK